MVRKFAALLTSLVEGGRRDNKSSGGSNPWARAKRGSVHRRRKKIPLTDTADTGGFKNTPRHRCLIKTHNPDVGDLCCRFERGLHRYALRQRRAGDSRHTWVQQQNKTNANEFQASPVKDYEELLRDQSQSGREGSQATFPENWLAKKGVAGKLSIWRSRVMFLIYIYIHTLELNRAKSIDFKEHL